MKKLIALLTVLMIITGVQAQFFSVGLKGGIQSTTIKMDKLMLQEGGADQFWVEAGDAKVGFHFGAQARIKVAGVFIQPELLFAAVNTEMRVRDISTNLAEIKNQEFKNLSIPILVGYKIGPARIQLGPAANIVLSSESEITGFEEMKETFKGATWGYQIGAGLDIWKLTFDLRYEGNLSKLGESINFGNTSFATDSRSRQLILSLGIMF